MSRPLLEPKKRLRQEGGAAAIPERGAWRGLEAHHGPGDQEGGSGDLPARRYGPRTASKRLFSTRFRVKS